MKTIKLTAQEIRMLEIQMGANPCMGGCPIETPRLPLDEHGRGDCYARNKNGQYICPLQRALESIQNKLEGKEDAK